MIGQEEREELLSKIPRRSKGWRLAQSDDAWILHHPAKTGVLSVNQTAALIWGLCNGEYTVARLIDLLKQAYPESAESIPGDTEEALRLFRGRGCVEWSEPPA